MRKHKEKFEDIVNTGFGPQSFVEGSRLINKKGEANLKKVGMPFWNRISVYHSLLRMTTGRFLLIVFLSYTTLNLLFALLYYWVGVEHLVGVDGHNSTMYQFLDAFFFSSQTLTTVGYGHVAPSGLATNTIAACESLVGILVFAVVTGLLYGRFSRPRAFIVFSHNAIIAPYKNSQAIMFRIASYKNNYLTDVEAAVTVALHEDVDSKLVTKFYQLPLEISRINSLALSWTIVHDLNEKSPLYGYTYEDLTNYRMEMIVSIKAFDEHFSNIVQQRTSYTYRELVEGAKFLPMFRKAPNGTHTILELQKVNAFEKAALPKMEILDTGSLKANA
jgi:inward rectifier potassium channel